MISRSRYLRTNRTAFCALLNYITATARMGFSTPVLLRIFTARTVLTAVLVLLLNHPNVCKGDGVCPCIKADCFSSVKVPRKIYYCNTHYCFMVQVPSAGYLFPSLLFLLYSFIILSRIIQQQYALTSEEPIMQACMYLILLSKPLL